MIEAMKYLIIGHRHPGTGGTPCELGSSTDMQAAIAKAKEFATYLEAYAKVSVEADGPGGTHKTWLSVPCKAATGVPEPKPAAVRLPARAAHVNPYTRDQLPPALRETPKMSDSNGSKPAAPVDLSTPAFKHPMPDEQIRTSRLEEIKAAAERRKQQPRSEAPSPVPGKPWAELKKREKARLIEGLAQSMDSAATADVVKAAAGRGWQIEDYQVRAARKRLGLTAEAGKRPLTGMARPGPRAAPPAATPVPVAPVQPAHAEQSSPRSVSSLISDVERIVVFARSVKAVGGTTEARRLLDEIETLRRELA